MQTNYLGIVYEQVNKLAQLILKFPSTTAERSLSALKRIKGDKGHLRSTRSQNRLIRLAMQSIEVDLLMKMKKIPEEFYSKGTENLTKKGRRLEFMLK